MQRYYTHIQNAHGYQRDTEGTVFSSDETAREQAVRTGAAVLADELLQGDGSVKLTLFIEEGRRQVAAVALSATVQVGVSD